MGLTEFGCSYAVKIRRDKLGQARVGLQAGRPGTAVCARENGKRLSRGEGMIYLDSGATTLEKPPAVARAWLRPWGRCPLRDGETIRPPKRRPGRPMIAGKRRQSYSMFRRREQVIFTCNATHGLNIAIRTLCARAAEWQ